MQLESVVLMTFVVVLHLSRTGMVLEETGMPVIQCRLREIDKETKAFSWGLLMPGLW